jgi:hypothetical protein
MANEDELKKALLAIKLSAPAAKAYVKLYKGLNRILGESISDLASRAREDEPSTEADRAIVNLIKKILDEMDAAQKLVDQEENGNNLENH